MLAGAAAGAVRWCAHRVVTGPQRTQWARQLRGITCTTSLRPHAMQ
jgi:hypothetical protein